MKSIISFISALVLSTLSFSQAVQLNFNKEELSKSDTLHFTITSSPEILLEIVVFTEDKLILHQNSRLNSEIPFDIPMRDYPPGKYRIMVISDDVNIQRDFVLKD